MAGKKISQLSSGSLLNLPLSGLTAVVYSGITYQHSLSNLRQILVDSGSHVFTGSQVINGNLTISGSITAQQYILSSSITNITTETISGSSNFGNSLDDIHRFTGSVNVTGSLLSNKINVGPATNGLSGSEYAAAHISTSGSINIAHFEGNNQYYAQVNITNKNSGSLASSDLVLTSDNGNETVHFVDLGINSSTYNGGYVGYENDAYLLNVGKDLYVGTVGGTSHPAELKLFANNSWENPQITVHTGSEISFNTSSVTSGYLYEFSGSVKLQDELKVDGSVTASYFVGDGSHLTNLPVQSTDVSMFLSSSTFNTFTSSYNITSASFDSRITAATNEQDLSYFATTGSNTFNGNQIINGTITLDNNSVIKDTANQSISFGVDSAVSGQGTQSTAIGSNAGQTDQGNGATALGALAGNLTQGQSAVAIGALAGSTLQGEWAIAIGTQAGGINQGNYSIALGNLAGGLNQAQNSIVINATGTQLDNTTTSSLKIAPIRNVVGNSGVLQYNTTTKEVSYSDNIVGSFSGSLDYSYLINVPTLVSQSSQISYTGITDVPNGLISGSSQISNMGYAITGSNTFNGYQIISGSIYMGTGSIVLSKGTEIYDIGTPGSTSGIGLGNNGFNIDFGSNVNDWAIFQNARIIQMSPTDQFTIFITSAGEYAWNFNALGMGFPDGTNQTTAFTGFPDGLVSGSSQIQYSGLTGIPSGLVSGSSQISYTGITNKPNGLISGSLQISALGYATTGSNTFDGVQYVNADIVIGGASTLYGNKIGEEVFGSGISYTSTGGGHSFTGSMIIQGVSEVMTVDGGFNGNRTFDYTSGSIFYLTGVTGNGTWNVQNVPTTNNKAIALTYVIEQGVTPYSGSQYQINGSNVTVKWVDNTIPTGSANNTEIIGLTAFRVGSSWNVIGSLSTFGV